LTRKRGSGNLGRRRLHANEYRIGKGGDPMRNLEGGESVCASTKEGPNSALRKRSPCEAFHKLGCRRKVARF